MAMAGERLRLLPGLEDARREDVEKPIDQGAATIRTARRRRFEEPSPSAVAEQFVLLEQAAVFYALPDRTLRALARRMRPVRLSAGDVVVRQGEDTASIFFIRSGHCQLRLQGPGSHSVAVALLSTGDFFGELAVLNQLPAEHTAVALDDCHLLAIDRTAIYAVLGSDETALADLTRLGQQLAAGYTGIAAQLGWSQTAGSSRVIAFYSPKGGSGSTTIALNVAGALAHRYPGQVVLLDLSFPFTQAALLANLVPVSSLARVADASPETVDELLLSAVLLHPGGLMVLPGCIRPEEADLVTPQVIARAMAILRRTFRYIVVDLGVAITEAVLAIFDEADRILLLVPPELAAIKAAQDANAIFTKVLGFPPDRVNIILNSRSPRPAVTKTAVERRLNATVAVEVGYDGSRPEEAALSGQILSLSEKSSEVSRGARRIVELLDADVVAGSEAGSAHQPREQEVP
jgi:pilus assembly protein CpaE